MFPVSITTTTTTTTVLLLLQNVCVCVVIKIGYCIVNFGVHLSYARVTLSLYFFGDWWISSRKKLESLLCAYIGARLVEFELFFKARRGGQDAGVRALTHLLAANASRRKIWKLEKVFFDRWRTLEVRKAYRDWFGPPSVGVDLRVITGEIRKISIKKRPSVYT